MNKVIDLNLQENKLTREIVDCIFQVHAKLGPGLLESVYEECLSYELGKKSLSFETQKQLPIRYDDIIIKSALRLDVVVESQVVLELKSIEKILPVHEAQILTYLKLSALQIGFLVNFNVPLIKHGIKRFVNEFKENSAHSAPPR